MGNILYANPITQPDLFNILIVAGVTNPGLAQLTDGAGRVYQWDVKQSPGIQGATITYRGLRPSDGIKFKFSFWLPEQITEFYSTYIPLLAYDATKKDPRPINVLHPILTANDIFDLVTEDIGPLTHEGQQLWTVTVTFKEYRVAKRKNVTTTPNSTNTSATTQGAKPSVLDQQDVEIQQLLNQAEAP